jgi:hypothetical protein
MQNNVSKSLIQHNVDTRQREASQISKRTKDNISYCSKNSHVIPVSSIHCTCTTDVAMLTKIGHDECSICIDRFQIGDIVSMSPNLSLPPHSCQHMFHYICIKE